ncbi:MAG TPA: hypothetical protein VL614_08030 [Acetobacteraceae bacterium]|jgi:hypothetical protein|nr:hypothetical protein [Acetobacteraceae bacterium]
MTHRDPQPLAEAESQKASEYSVSPLLYLCFLQSILFLAFASGRLDTPWYLSCHLGLCVITAALGARWVSASMAEGAAGTRFALVLQLAGWMALGGPFGTLVATALYVPEGEPGSIGNVAKRRRFELPRHEALLNSLLDHRLRLHGVCAARPMIDIMIEGTRLEKLDALGVISRRYAPAFAVTLRRALQDSDNSVRVLAATVLAQQHGIFAKRIGALQARAKEDPGNPEVRRGLGQAGLAYADSGLLEAAQARALAREAHTNLAHAVESEQKHDETQSSVARDVPCSPKLMSA